MFLIASRSGKYIEAFKSFHFFNVKNLQMKSMKSSEYSEVFCISFLGEISSDLETLTQKLALKNHRFVENNTSLGKIATLPGTEVFEE